MLSTSLPARAAASVLLVLCLLAALVAVAPEASARSARIELHPAAGPPGTIVTVHGRGFAPRASGAVRIRGGPERHLAASRSGEFTTRLWIPSSLPARARISATLAGARASERFTVERPAPPFDWRRLLRSARSQPPPVSQPNPPPPEPEPAAAPAPAGSGAPAPGAPAPDAQPAADALGRRAQAELRQFTDWLARSGAQGYVGEVGWPRDDRRWNDLARTWYADAARAGLWVTNWATGEWWGEGYELSSYHAPDALRVRAANQQAEVIESQPEWYLRGVNVNGGEFGAVSGNPAGNPHRHSFSNANPGEYEHAYHYDTQATFDYLASRGIGLIRLPFRWERIQPQPGGALDGAEVQRLAAAVDRAGAAGLRVVLDLHNYGAYYLHDGSGGARRTVGSPQLTNAHFADVWSRLSAAFAGNRHVVGYGLMNEPVGTAGGARGWEDATQRAVDAIRARGDGTTVLVPGYNWSTVIHFRTQHPNGPWIRDPMGSVRYEAHQYFDRDNSGSYAAAYDAEVRDAQQRGY